MSANVVFPHQPSIPQQPPFVFVDQVLAADSLTATTSYRVTDHTLLIVDDRLSAAGLVEHVAQTCAAWQGEQLHEGDMPHRGMIGAVKRLETYRLPSVGEEMVSRMQVMEQVFGMLLANVEVAVKNELIAQAEIKLTIE